jgi:glycosyltransferase involved in cell wall biosynthesis
VSGGPLIVLDADVLGRQRTGDEAYVRNLLVHLPATDSGARFGAVTRHPDLVPAGIERLPLTSGSQVTRMSWTLPRLLHRVDAGIAHFQYVISPLWRGPAVVTVHDISFTRQPEQARLRDRVFFRTLVPAAMRRAEVVLTVSEFTKQDIVQRYGLPADKILVTYNGVDRAFVRDGHRPTGAPYLLFVGALQPRKDPIGAIRAFAQLKDLGDDVRLLMVGPEKHQAADVRAVVASLRLEDRVDFLGHVDTDHLAALYRGALCLVFPSTYEGFGLPIVEAMASGTPVVACNVTAVPEVAGDAAVLVPPLDPEALADGVRQALRRRDELTDAGLARCRRFRWEDCAERTLAGYQQALRG